MYHTLNIFAFYLSDDMIIVGRCAPLVLPAHTVQDSYLAEEESQIKVSCQSGYQGNTMTTTCFKGAWSEVNTSCHGNRS